jgi:D-threo-aldose 1-dehydrogenase
MAHRNLIPSFQALSVARSLSNQRNLATAAQAQQRNRRRDCATVRRKSSDMTPQSTLPRRVLGRTGLSVSALGFGTAPLGDLFAHLDDTTAIATVERAFELGINLLDTSPLYGRGLSEHRCGTAIRRVPRQDIVLCTKVGRWMDPFHAPNDASAPCGGRLFL